MRMLRWINWMTRKDGIRNEYIRSMVVASIMVKIREKRLGWFGHVMRRRFGSSKNSYGIEHGRKKRKGKTKEVVKQD